MDLKGMIELRLVVVLCMITLVHGAISITFGNSECEGKPEYVSDQGNKWDYINSSCNCTIISNHTGKLFFQPSECRLLNSAGAEISHCSGGVNVTKNSKLRLIRENAKSSLHQARNSYQTIIIHIHSNLTDLFSVSCGPALGSTTRSISRLTSTTSTIKASLRDPVYGLRTIPVQKDVFNIDKSNHHITFSKPDFPSSPRDPVDDLQTTPVQRDVSTIDKPNHHITFSKPDFPYMYVVAAGSIVAVVVLIVFVVVCIRRSRSRIISKEETKGIAAQNNAIVLEDSKNLGPIRQLSDNPLYVSYQENDDGGYSAFGNENQGSAENLPENPLYHSCQVNKDKEESMGKKEKSVGEIASNRNTSENVSDAVYAQPNKIAKVLNANQDECAVGQKEPVYAEVNKTKRK